MTKTKMRELTTKQLNNDLEKDMRDFFLEVESMLDNHKAKNEMTVRQIRWVLVKCTEFLDKWQNTNPDSKYWLKLIDAGEELNKKAKGNILTKELLLMIMKAIEKEKNQNL